MTIADVLTATTTISPSLKWKGRLLIMRIIKPIKLILNLIFNLPRSSKNIMIQMFFNPAIRQLTSNLPFKITLPATIKISSLNTIKTSPKTFHFIQKHRTIKAMRNQMYSSFDIGQVLTSTPICL